MRIAVIGAGGREHALAWKLKQSPLCEQLYCLPGNAGTAAFCENISINGSDYAGIIKFAKDEKINLVVVGPEQPLADGLADMLRSENISVVGVSKKAAELESSKAFAKDFCFRHNIPCATSRSFDDLAEATSYIEQTGVPIVIKADGLAAGKGVIVANTMAEALEAVSNIMGGAFGSSGNRIVIEECLTGDELSFFALCDGKNAVPLLGVCDHKAAYDGGKGPNTGGMGTYAPAAFVDKKLQMRIMDEIAMPTLRGMEAEGMAYSGIMFMGLFVKNGEPKLIEYNVRFGDPECQILMMLLQSDLVEVFNALVKGELNKIGDLSWRDDYAVNVVLAAENYPAVPVLGGEIILPDGDLGNVEIFHAGTKLDGGKLVSSGGRVLSVASYGSSLQQARGLAYDVIKGIKLTGSFYRTDIGVD